jgi:hypothetical protein
LGTFPIQPLSHTIPRGTFPNNPQSHPYTGYLAKTSLA